MPDLRELFDSPEEGFRAMWAGIRGHLHTIMVSRVTKASDGHTVEAQPTVQQAVQDPTLTQTTYLDYPLVLDSPVHFPGGAGAVLTHGLAVGDEVVTLFAENAVDAWHQQGGTAQPISDRKHSLSDGITIPGIRSDARPTPPVSVRKSIGDDFLVSMEDGKRYKSLKRHLSSRGLTPDEYRAKWGLPNDYPLVAPSYARARSELAKSMGLGQQRRKW